jgi:hypothetical protein
VQGPGTLPRPPEKVGQPVLVAPPAKAWQLQEGLCIRRKCLRCVLAACGILRSLYTLSSRKQTAESEAGQAECTRKAGLGGQAGGSIG